MQESLLARCRGETFAVHGSSLQRIGREDAVAAYLRELAGPLSEWSVVQAIKVAACVGTPTAYRYRETLIADGRLVPMKDGRSWTYRAGRTNA